MAKKILASIEASDGSMISLWLNDDGRIWHTVERTGAQFASGAPQGFKSEAEAIKAIRETWGKPSWNLKFTDEASNQA